jgi:hypothetical protein
MTAVTIKQFIEKTGISQRTLNRRLGMLNAHPVGTTMQQRTSFLWSLEDLEKALSLVGVYTAPRGRRRKG